VARARAAACGAAAAAGLRTCANAAAALRRFIFVALSAPRDAFSPRRRRAPR
jgi:hypothetical protein